MKFYILNKKFGRSIFIKVNGSPSYSSLNKLRKGIILNRKKLLPCKIKIVQQANMKCWLDVALCEGIKNQIKEMFHTINHPVLKIKRYQIGNIGLKDLGIGKVRQLKLNEIESLLKKIDAHGILGNRKAGYFIVIVHIQSEK